MSSRRPSLIAEFSAFTLSALGSIFFNAGDLLAGRSAVLFNNIRPLIPWVFLIYPLLLTTRGDINGIFAGKMGTQLHLGTIVPSFFHNEKRFYELISLVLVLSLYDSVLISIVATVVGLLLGISINFLSVSIITLSTFFLTSLFSIFLTSNLAFFVFKRNADPDVFVYPISSMVNDILMTLIFVAVCYFYHPWRGNFYLFAGLPIIFIIFVAIAFFTLPLPEKTLIIDGFKQSSFMLFLTTLIAAGTGSVLSSFEHILGTIPSLIVVYPAVLATVGSQNAIIANTTTTKLHTGSLSPALSEFKSKEVLIPISAVMFAGIIMSVIYGFFGVILYSFDVSVSFFFMFLLILTLSNIIANFMINLVTLPFAFLTYKFGLDPDNLVIPLLSTIADLVTTTTLVLLARMLLI
ncbi:MAG: magnesium transporter [Candidatus Heimdallarchaeaceae archaeon]